MKRESNIRRAPFFNRGIHRNVKRGLNAAAIALFASLAGSPFANAASFHCSRNASASERLVCNDPSLSALDDQLAALYRNALDASSDTTALEADRVSQWQWRQHNCKDKACVADWYNRRIAELEGDVKHGKQATVQRVKESVVDQHLAPSAQDAVLEMKHIETKPKGQSATDDAKGVTKAGAKVAAADDNASLHLKKMPSGMAADARQQRLAEAHKHHLPASDVAPTAMEAKMAASGGAFAKAAGIAPIDAPLAHRDKDAANGHAEEKAPDQAASKSADKDASEPAKSDASVALK